jgi:hypothetical protein
VPLGDRASCLTSFAREYEGSRTDSILLNGSWEFVRGEGDEHAETARGGEKLRWQQVTLPGTFMTYKVWEQEASDTKFVWARRSFEITPDQAKGLAVLRWNRVACGAAAYINGQMVGENEPTGPFQVIVPAGVLTPGDNQIVLKIRGAAGVRRSKSGSALIPAGFGVGMPGTDTCGLTCRHRYMKWVLDAGSFAVARGSASRQSAEPPRI